MPEKYWRISETGKNAVCGGRPQRSFSSEKNACDCGSIRVRNWKEFVKFGTACDEKYALCCFLVRRDAGAMPACKAADVSPSAGNGFFTEKMWRAMCGRCAGDVADSGALSAGAPELEARQGFARPGGRATVQPELRQTVSAGHAARYGATKSRRARARVRAAQSRSSEGDFLSLSRLWLPTSGPSVRIRTSALVLSCRGRAA